MKQKDKPAKDKTKATKRASASDSTLRAQIEAAKSVNDLKLILLKMLI